MSKVVKPAVINPRTALQAWGWVQWGARDRSGKRTGNWTRCLGLVCLIPAVLMIFFALPFCRMRRTQCQNTV